MIGEPVLGVAGMIPPPDDYWPRVAAVLRAHGILLILDEIVTGLRPHRAAGSRAERWGGIPADLIVTAKALTSGYVPMGAVLIGDRVMELLDGARFAHGFTYNGHPDRRRGRAATTSTIIEREGLLERAAELGERLLDGAARGRGRCPPSPRSAASASWRASSSTSRPTAPSSPRAHPRQGRHRPRHGPEARAVAAARDRGRAGRPARRDHRVGAGRDGGAGVTPVRDAARARPADQPVGRAGRRDARRTSPSTSRS